MGLNVQQNRSILPYLKWAQCQRNMKFKKKKLIKYVSLILFSTENSHCTSCVVFPLGSIQYNKATVINELCHSQP